MPFSPADFTFCILQTAYLICKSLLFTWHKGEAFFLFFVIHFHVRYNTLYFIFLNCVLCESFFLFFGNHFHVKYITLYFIFIKSVLCEAVGSSDQNQKTFKTLLFFTRKKKQKILPSATSAKGGFALVLV